MINIFWLRRDLMLEDNTALSHALKEGLPVMPLFVFDTNITDEMPENDPRISFIYDTLSGINEELRKTGSSVRLLRGDPSEIWESLTASFNINAVYINKDYEKHRDHPAVDRTSYLSPHLRFGTVSIRKIARIAAEQNQVFLSELIWREFFMQILCHFPNVVTENFKRAYDDIRWRNDESEFKRWCSGETGYPIVDAGMRQLNETGYMHNRVRMITAGFLCKHLLIDWRWGEAYFAQKLLDYKLSSNNGNWQWAAGTGCDAAPYFRVFNPDTQQKKFDPEKEYIRKWIKDADSSHYPMPIIEHDFARRRAIEVYQAGIKSYSK